MKNTKQQMAEVVKVAIVIPVYNRKEDTLNCLLQLKSLNKQGMEIMIIVVDDGSKDGTSEAIRADYPEVVLLHGNGNLWWSGATNKGVEYSLDHSCDYILTLNDDIELDNDFLMHMLETAQSNDYVNDNIIVCSVICDIGERTTIVSAGRYAKGFLGYNYSGYLVGKDISVLPAQEYESDIESGYAMLIPADIFKEVGLFDFDTFPQNMGDMDFVLRAKRTVNARVMINPKARLFAERSGSYFHSQIVNKSLYENLKAFFDLKSTVHLKTRWSFCWRHTPHYLGLLSYIYFIIRMISAVILKSILPNKALVNIIKKRKKLPI